MAIFLGLAFAIEEEFFIFVTLYRKQWYDIS